MPPGFVVTTDVYRASIAANGMVDAPPVRLRERIPAAPVPEEIGTAILDAYRRLGELASVGGMWPPSSGRIAEIRALATAPLVDPRLFARSGTDGDVLLRGTPGSPGAAEGPVRIIRDGAEFGRLRAGEVLVAPYTNPARTPLFQRAVAVVVDSGSAASHAAIVAREYGIPAVMATGTATRALPGLSGIKLRSGLRSHRRLPGEQSGA